MSPHALIAFFWTSLVPPLSQPGAPAPLSAEPGRFLVSGQDDFELVASESPRTFSGISPHLASFNGGNECGIGAVVPWADRLWWITYPPHAPKYSDDRLHMLDRQGRHWVYAKKVGGTHANRMIHRETNQLLIGRYVIDARGGVRVLSPDVMPGRLTGTSRHLEFPAHLAYYATMEEGFYEVDLRRLSVTELFPDANGTNDPGGPLLPGYHGKGLYTGQGRLIYSNNGEQGAIARRRPDIPSGSLSSWTPGAGWSVVRRNQFTEVSGPGGLLGANSSDEPVWSTGWDHRSLLLLVLMEGRWHTYRLPKASHCYDGAHGWNTEWPRIRDIGEHSLLMTMHGAFWRFPKNFGPERATGLKMRSTYLKVIADFGRWNDKVVFGCDDSAYHEFLNKRKSKGELAGPAQSQSNLWFVEPDQLDRFGPSTGKGAWWIDDPVEPNTPSDPMLVGPWEHRSVHLAHDSLRPVHFRLAVDRTGDGRYELLRDVVVPPLGSLWVDLHGLTATWLRLSVDRACRATAWFTGRDRDRRPTSVHEKFAGLSSLDAALAGDVTGGFLRAESEEYGLAVLPTSGATEELLRPPRRITPRLEIVADDTPDRAEWLSENLAVPREVVRIDGHSIVFVEDDGVRYRLPIGDRRWLDHPDLLQNVRIDREVCTERDIFHCAGIFYELPARNAGGFSRVRPIATHDRWIQDFASWRGMMALTGSTSNTDGNHWVTNDDNSTAVWLGTIDDLWSLGKATGFGGPWHDTPVHAGVPSDPYLFGGFDHRTLIASHTEAHAVSWDLEVHFGLQDQWLHWRTIEVAADKPHRLVFPRSLDPIWIRLTSHHATTATATFIYE